MGLRLLDVPRRREVEADPPREPRIPGERGVLAATEGGPGRLRWDVEPSRDLGDAVQCGGPCPQRVFVRNALTRQTAGLTRAGRDPSAVSPVQPAQTPLSQGGAQLRHLDFHTSYRKTQPADWSPPRSAECPLCEAASRTVQMPQKQMDAPSSRINTGTGSKGTSDGQNLSCRKGHACVRKWLWTPLLCVWEGPLAAHGRRLQSSLEGTGSC